MFNPIGPQSPAVYWRRRLVVLGSIVLLLVLLVLTVNAVRSSGGDNAAAGSPTSSVTSSRPASTTPPPTTAPRTSTRASSSTSKAASSTARSSRSSTAAPAVNCVVKSLQLRAVAGKSTYKVGDAPVLQLQVTNPGTRPCVQNLADKQIELRVYNGESRIWGSHDCKIAPGTTDRTLAPDVSVLVSVKWSGLTSKPGCAGTRQRVGAGTYTLYAALSGRQAHATQFSIS